MSKKLTQKKWSHLINNVAQNISRPETKIFFICTSLMISTHSDKQRIRITALIDAGFSLADISRKMNIPYSTVKNVAARYRATGTVERQKGSGRSTLLVEEDTQLLMAAVRQNPKISTSKLANYLLSENGKSVSRDTIRRFLHTQNLGSYVAAVKPLLTPAHVSRRLQVVNVWRYLPLTYFKRVVFSDESRFKVFQSDGKCLVWREPGTRYAPANCSPSLKFGGGSVMI